jgi:hypothetical protein
MSGTFRGSFAHGDEAGALAYGGSTDTLWLVDNGNNTLRQFSKAGALIDTDTTSSNHSSNVWGAEFQSVPFVPFAGGRRHLFRQFRSGNFSY